MDIETSSIETVKAKELYHSLGFYEIQPYFKNLVEGIAFMEKKLKEE